MIKDGVGIFRGGVGVGNNGGFFINFFRCDKIKEGFLVSNEDSVLWRTFVSWD